MGRPTCLINYDGYFVVEEIDIGGLHVLSIDYHTIAEELNFNKPFVLIV